MDKTQIVTADQGQLRQLTPQQIEENMRLIDDLKFFLATAPANWQKNQIIRRYYLNHDEGFVSCVYWNNLYFVTGTDIVRCIVYRFEQFGREITDRKKFEEGVFSDLRSLKCGSDAVLEPSKSPFLDFLYKNSCLRTQKKQKVFFWFSVPHDKLFADALERDLKKEQVNQPATTRARQEPALSFQYNAHAPLHEQLLQYAEVHKPDSADSDNATVTPNTNNDYSRTPPPTLQEETQEVEPQDLQQHTFFIKEEPESGTPVVTPGRLEDDFPLDYFPQSSGEPLLIDPSVFMNPPEHFDDQFLIDQTYAKTPFYETFEAGVLKREETSDDEDYMVPVSQLAQGYMAPMVQTPIVVGPNGGYYIQQAVMAPMMGGPQITNGQFYDHQLNGEEYEYELQDQQQQPQYYYPQVYYPVSQDPSQSHLPQFVQVSQPPPAFFGESDDGQQGQYYEQYEQGGSVMSPFARVFPSFQATAPPSATSSHHQQQSQQQPTSATTSSHRPQSAKSVRFPRIPATTLKPPHAGRVMKPSSLRQQRSVSNLKNKAEKIMKEVNKEEKKEDLPQLVEEQVVDAEGKDNEGEYTTLPTPESTVQDREAQQAGAE